MRYARVRVRIGASMSARRGIATEKVHVVGKSSGGEGGRGGGEGVAIAGRRGRASREGEWSREQMEREA